jgi:hypothetical protein
MSAKATNQMDGYDEITLRIFWDLIRVLGKTIKQKEKKQIAYVRPLLHDHGTDEVEVARPEFFVFWPFFGKKYTFEP